jgi:hypothetical protein
VTHDAIPLSGFHHPMTFASRGVSVTFTTPMLAGSRIRRAGTEDVELVVPNTFGGRGIYVLPWSGVRALAKPTAHDTVLYRHCLRLEAIEPATVRDAALAAAREGHAGRAAARAAELTIARDRAQVVRAHGALMLRLVERLGPDFVPVPPVAEQAAQRYARSRLLLERLAPSLGCRPTDLAAALTALAGVFAPIGTAGGERDARVPLLLRRLEETRADLAAWLCTDPANDLSGLGQAIEAAIGRICEIGASVLHVTRAARSDPVAPLQRWITDRTEILAQASRCDWLLDGWQLVDLVWRASATQAARRAALLEMAPLVPVLPREVLAWTDTVVPVEATQPACLVTSSQDSWRTGGAAFALTARNERLLATGT